MNLTYDEFSNGACDCERCASTHALISRAANNADRAGQPMQLAGFFDSLVKTTKLTIKGPANVMKAITKAKGDPKAGFDAWKKDFQQGREYAAERSKVTVPVLSALSPFTFGITGAVAAGIKRSTDELHKKKAQQLMSKNDNAGIMAEYSAGAGSVPGRAYGVDLLKRVLTAAIQSGEFPKGVGSKGDRIYWKGMENDFLDSKDERCTTSSKQCPPGIRTIAKEIASNGATADQLLSYWFDNNRLVNSEHQSGIARSILLDLADAALAEANPNIPYSYGVTADDFEQPASADPNKPLIKPAPGTAVTSTLAPISTTPAQQVASDNSRMIETLLANMQQQGADSSQMMAAAMQALASRGVDVQSAPVQEALETQVAQAGGSNVNPWILGGLGLAAVVFALARPARGGRRK